MKNNRILGVINLTPNSFSDPNPFKNANELLNHLLNQHQKNNKFFDFGAESTAPKNKGLVTDEEEFRRFKTFLFPIIKHLPIDFEFSIDTYRLHVFVMVYFEIRKSHPIAKIYWNDVSGVIDAEIERFLELVKGDVNLFYVASFTYTSERENAGFHMDYASENHQVVADFNLWQIRIEGIFKKFPDQLVLDPAFGFSKTYEQNFELISYLLHELGEQDAKTYMFGFSKKSFLRKGMECLKSSDPFSDSEYFHFYLLNLFTKINAKHKMIFRVHNLNILKFVELVQGKIVL